MGPLTELLAVARVDRATVDDARVLRNGGGHGGREEGADVRVRLLRLRRRRDLARPDRPNGLVRDHDLAAFRTIGQYRADMLDTVSTVAYATYLQSASLRTFTTGLS